VSIGALMTVPSRIARACGRCKASLRHLGS